MTFSDALAKILTEGKLLRRSAWLNLESFVFLVPGSAFTVSRPPLNTILPEGTLVRYRQHIDMYHGLDEGHRVISTWTPSSEDLEANDWIVVKPEQLNGIS